MFALLISLLAALGTISILALLKIRTLKSEFAKAQDSLSTLKQDSQNKAQLIAEMQAKLESMQHFHAQTLNDKNAYVAELKEAHKQELESTQKRNQENLKTLREELEKFTQAQKTDLLNQNKIMLNKDSRAMLEEIFTPLKKEMQDYSKNLLQNEASLKQNIEHIFNYSRKLGEDANKLAQVLQGDKKVRGNFGELQLKAVLESSGLQEGEHYELQSSFSEEGRRFVPDAVVYLDKDKGIVIDSKFSLPNLPNPKSNQETQDDFSDYDSPSPNASDSAIDCAKDFIPSELLQSQIAKNLKSRIDELAKKPYQKFKSSNPRFANAKIQESIFLFVPYNNILDLALQADSYIYQYAYQKGIYLTTPHTLFMALKTISISWVHIQSDEKVQKAFEEIGKFYDKFVAFCEDFNKLKRLLNQAQNTSEDIETKINGKGGIISRVENLRDLGAKTTKAIKKSNKNTDEAKDFDTLDKATIINNDEKWELAQTLDSSEISVLSDSKDIPQV